MAKKEAPAEEAPPEPEIAPHSGEALARMEAEQAASQQRNRDLEAAENRRRIEAVQP